MDSSTPTQSTPEAWRPTPFTTDVFGHWGLTATAEGLAIGTRAGLDPAVMTDVLNESTGGSWITRTHIHQRVLSRSFDDPFKLKLMLKDMGIALDLARELGVPAPVSGVGQQLWQAAHHARSEGASVSELVKWVEEFTGTEIPSPRPG